MDYNDNFILDINKHSGNARLLVCAARLWEIFHYDNLNQMLSVDMLLLDENGDVIHCSIHRTLYPKFKTILQEGECYAIQNFWIVENKGSLRIMSQEFRLHYRTDTVMKEFTGRSLPHYQFSFTPLPAIHNNNLNTSVCIGLHPLICVLC